MNPLAPLYATFNNGDPQQKHDTLSEGPLMVDVEPVGLCNFRCVMCPTGLQAMGRKGGFMSSDTHTALIEKTAPFGSAIRYIGWGEPLLHPNIVGFIREATAAKRLTHLNTNASKMTQGLADALVDSGLSSIKFSFQGTDKETYLSMRSVDFFEGVLRAINMMWLARGAGIKPFISVSTTTTDETEEQIQEFRDRVEPLVDDLTIGHTIFEFIDMAAVPHRHRERLENAARKQKVTKNHPLPCPEVYGKLSVHWDGAVRVCCNDFSGKTNLGNIRDASMQDIWKHPDMEAYRERLARKDYSGPLCSVCYDYHSLTEGTA